MRLMILSSLALTLFITASPLALENRPIIDLNGTWEFEQTETAFPPQTFTRTIPVPGLIFLAKPKIEQYDAYYEGTYEPKYNWYRNTFHVPKKYKDLNAILTILKSKYVTQAYLNGYDLGRSMACYTPIDFPATHAIQYGKENELLICVGDRNWLPSQAAGSTDKEKVTYFPGIWDNVYLSFNGPFRIHRALVLPNVEEKKVDVKLLIRSFYPAQIQYGDPMQDTCNIDIRIAETDGDETIAEIKNQKLVTKRDNLTQTTIEIPLTDFKTWSPEHPFLYTAKITVKEQSGSTSDTKKQTFGMRDFGRSGKHFTLNGDKLYLRGTNITLHRFFEDPHCGALPWNREWVTKLLNDIPKSLDWNAMRVCVGIAPSFWYDIADEAGLLLQNEWLYWQNHGWDEQIRTEYTDWVWSDGNHPSIAMWDAINENWDDFIGNVLIPDLKQLDPTRIWDAGYMTSEHMMLDEMDEPHPYQVYGMRDNFNEWMDKNPYPLGDLHHRTDRLQRHIDSSAAQLVNEYGWIWLWRNGKPAHLTVNNYAYYLGEDATPQERWTMQAYWLQLQTEWLRTIRPLAGLLSFCYLSDNYGFTGDWFIGDIADLNEGPTLKWFKHCFAPTAVFIDLIDERYTKHLSPHTPGSDIQFNLIGVNDDPQTRQGEITLRLLDSEGNEQLNQNHEISIPEYGKCYVPVQISLPEQRGGYLLLAEFKEDGIDKPVISRRYLKVGMLETYEYFDINP